MRNADGVFTLDGYKAPITTQYDLMAREIVKRNEECMCIQISDKLGYHVDLDELAKALNYDRKQYEKGYANGYEAGKKKAEESNTHEVFCTELIPVSWFRECSNIEIMRGLCEKIGVHLMQRGFCRIKLNENPYGDGGCIADLKVSVLETEPTDDEKTVEEGIAWLKQYRDKIFGTKGAEK